MSVRDLPLYPVPLRRTMEKRHFLYTRVCEIDLLGGDKRVEIVTALLKLFLWLLQKFKKQKKQTIVIEGNGVKITLDNDL